jgi:hypothetical protein
MRQDILNYMLGQNLGVITASQELPWDSDGIPLYEKNLKKVYVDQDEITIEPLVITLNADNLHTETTSVRAYIACDAKQTPPNFNEAVLVMRNAMFAVTDTGIRQRNCAITRSYTADVLVTEFEFTFTKHL